MTVQSHSWAFIHRKTWRAYAKVQVNGFTGKEIYKVINSESFHKEEG